MLSKLIILTTLFALGTCVFQCHVCNTMKYEEGQEITCPECDDQTNNTIEIKNDRWYMGSKCESENIDESSVYNCSNGYTGCLKVTQDATGAKSRTFRQCAKYRREDGCIERTGTQGIKVILCFCTSDRCNSAILNLISQPLLLISIIWRFF